MLYVLLNQNLNLNFLKISIPKYWIKNINIFILLNNIFVWLLFAILHSFHEKKCQLNQCRLCLISYQNVKR